MEQMVECAGCHAMVPPAKAFCPNCGEPMEAEEQRRSNRGIENMAQTVIGVSLSQLQTPEPEAAPASPPPAAAQPAPLQTPPVAAPPATPAPPPVAEKPAAAPVAQPTPSSGGSKAPLFIIGGIVVVVILLALLVALLFFAGILTFTVTG